MSPYKPRPLATASYPLAGGMDSKVHGLVLPPPKLQRCENLYVDRTGSIQRRFGRSFLANTTTAGVTIATGSLIATGKHQERLLAFSSNKLYDFGEAESRWADRGRATSWALETKAIDSPDSRGSSPGGKDIAKCGQYTLYAYDYYSATNTTTAFTLVDSKGTRYASGQVLATVANPATFSSVKVVAHGTRFYIVYYDVSTVSTVKCFIINTASATTIASSLAGAAATVALPAFEFLLAMQVNAAQGPFLAWRQTVGLIGMGFLDTAGALQNASTLVSIGGATSLSCDVTGLTTHGIAYSTNVTPNDVYSSIRSFSAGVWTTIANSGTMDTALIANAISVACKFDSSTVLRVWYADALSAIVSLPCIRQATLNTAGTVGVRVALLPRSLLVARPFVATDGDTYYWVMSEPVLGIAQPTFYLMMLDGSVSATASVGLATLGLFGLVGGMSHVPVGGATGETSNYSLIADQYTRIANSGTTGWIFPGPGTSSAMVEIITNFAPEHSHVTAEDGQCTYIPGGFLQQYDGSGVTEVGFLAFVDTQNRITIGAAQITNGAGALDSTAGTIYSYHIVPEWTNAQGEREQGTDNGAKTTLTADWLAGDDTVTFTIDCIPWTLKKSPRPNLVFAVYRTLKNPTSTSPFFRVGTKENDPAADSVTFVDLMSDAVAATQEQFYQGTGELDNIPPGSGGSIVAAGNGRVFVAGFPQDPNLVLYSKTRGHGSPLTFNDALQIVFPSATGPLTALAVFNESLIAFTATAIYRVNGPGLSNLGTTGGYTDPVLVQADAGALGMRGVVVTPMGVMFESAKGKMVLRSNFTVEYIGAPLEKLTDPGVPTGACLVPALQQVRFSYAARTHVYDYYHAQWYVFTHGSAGPTCVWNEAHTAADAENIVYDDSAVWDDGGDNYVGYMELAWFHGTALPGDVTVRKIGLTGQALATTVLTVLLFQDQSTTLSQSMTETIGAAAAISREWRVAKQVCSQIEVVITDGTPDAYGGFTALSTAGWRLNELTFELALRSALLGRSGT